NLNQFKFIHIAGTSGKGTVTAMVHQILHQAGYKIGSFYSPHPTTSIERIYAGANYISPSDFVKMLDKIKPSIEDVYLNSKYGLPSYFEILFALALLYFQQKKCEYVVLEAGCGGEFDATNIIKKPLITAITNIGFDHTQLLGNTLQKIAKTKAGIIKPGSIFLTTEKRKAILKIFQSVCYKTNAKFIPLISSKNTLTSNTMLATQICEKLHIKQEAISMDLKNFSLSCRFEIAQKNPTVILDGAHNFDKIKSTVDNLQNLEFKKLFLIFTLNENKDVKRIINYIAGEQKFVPLQTNIYITRHLVSSRTCADLKLMYNLFLDANKKLKPKIFLDPWQALKQAIKKAGKHDLILITGSFYLAGELRKKWISEEKILKNNQ
ncbi:MAG: Mur ligase family protein, partial [Patescibacteria group bacterium]